MPTDAGVGLSRSFKLWVDLHRADRALFRRVELALVPQGLSLPQFQLLAILHLSGRALPVGEIARLMVNSDQTATGLSDRAEARGWVERRRDRKASDRRVTTIALTEDGRKKLQKAWPVADAALESIFRSVGRDHSLTILENICLALRDAAAAKP